MHLYTRESELSKCDESRNNYKSGNFIISVNVALVCQREQAYQHTYLLYQFNII